MRQTITIQQQQQQIEQKRSKKSKKNKKGREKRKMQSHFFLLSSPHSLPVQNFSNNFSTLALLLLFVLSRWTYRTIWYASKSFTHCLLMWTIIVWNSIFVFWFYILECTLRKCFWEFCSVHTREGERERLR